MQGELLIAILAGLGGMLGWGLADFFAKKTIDQVGDVVSLVWGHVFGTAVLFLTAFFQFGVRGQHMAVPHDFFTWLFLLFFGALQAAVYLLVYKGFGKGKVGLLSPVFASFSGLTAIVSVAVLGEAVGGYLLLGLSTRVSRPGLDTRDRGVGARGAEARAASVSRRGRASAGVRGLLEEAPRPTRKSPHAIEDFERIVPSIQ